MQLTAKQLFGSGLSWRDIFTEIPIKIHNSALVTALMAEIDRQVILDSVSATRLRLNTMPFLEKQLDLMGDCIESLYMEVQDMSKYERARARQEQLKAAWLARRQEVCLYMFHLRVPSYCFCGSGGPKNVSLKYVSV